MWARAGHVSSSDPFGLRDFRAREDPPGPRFPGLHENGRGSTVRVRQRGLQKSSTSPLSRSARVATSAACGGYGAVYGSLRRQNGAARRKISGTNQALRQNAMSRLKTKRPALRAFSDGRYWARTSDPSLSIRPGAPVRAIRCQNWLELTAPHQLTTGDANAKVDQRLTRSLPPRTTVHRPSVGHSRDRSTEHMLQLERGRAPRRARACSLDRAASSLTREASRLLARA